MQTTYAIQSGVPVLLTSSQEIEGAQSPDGPEGEVQHAGRPVEDHDPHTGECVHPAEGQPGHDEQLEERRD